MFFSKKALKMVKATALALLWLSLYLIPLCNSIETRIDDNWPTDKINPNHSHHKSNVEKNALTNQ